MTAIKQKQLLVYTDFKTITYFSHVFNYTKFQGQCCSHLRNRYSHHDGIIYHRAIRSMKTAWLPQHT